MSKQEMLSPPPIPWHRLFGLILDDVLHRLLHIPCEVRLEEELSKLRQLLDVVIIRRKKLSRKARLPDGLDLNAEYNLITYKSHQEPLNEWTIQELIGHYVNYRKLMSSRIDKDKLLPEKDFQLYAVSTRYPQGLESNQGYPLTLEKTSHDGVYHLDWGRADIRVIITSEVALTPNNVLWNLFGNNSENVRYGLEHFKIKESTISSVIRRLLNYYLSEEKAEMTYTIEDFNRDYLPEIMASIPIEDRLKGIPVSERLRGIPVDERLKGLSTEEIERYLATVKSRIS